MMTNEECTWTILTAKNKLQEMETLNPNFREQFSVVVLDDPIIEWRPSAAVTRKRKSTEPLPTLAEEDNSQESINDQNSIYVKIPKLIRPKAQLEKSLYSDIIQSAREIEYLVSQDTQNFELNCLLHAFHAKVQIYSAI